MRYKSLWAVTLFASGLPFVLQCRGPDRDAERQKPNVDLFRLIDHFEEVEFTETPLRGLLEDSEEEQTQLPPRFAELIENNIYRDGKNESSPHPFILKITKSPRPDSVRGLRTKNAILAPAPTTFSFSMRPAEKSTLDFGYGVILESVADRVGIFRFEIWVENLDTQSRTQIFNKELAPEFDKRHRRWLHRRLPLDELANQNLKFTFQTSVVGDPVPNTPICVWVNPTVVKRKPSRKRPNVLLISMDTLRADHLGCYGYSRDTSPYIDHIADEGVRFNWAISQAPYTLSSHMSLLTSLYPSFHKVNKLENNRLNPKITTLAEVLYNEGYRTWAITGGGQTSHSYGFAQGFETYIQYTSREHDVENKVEETTNFLRGEDDTSFFIFFHSYKTHAPYIPAPPYDKKFDPDYQGDITADLDTIDAINNGDIEISPEDLNHIISLYDGEIREADSALVPLFRHLKRKGLEENTLVIFTSDHGEEFGEHGDVARHSRTLFDELIRVPLIFRLPGVLPAGKVIEDQVQSIDILPTILDLVGAESERESFQGTSLASLMSEGGSTGISRYAFSEKLSSDPIFLRSLRSSENKHIFKDNRATEQVDHFFFDLRNDPTEQVSKQVDSRSVEEMRDRIAFLVEEGEIGEEVEIHKGIDQETWKALKELGYVK